MIWRISTVSPKLRTTSRRTTSARGAKRDLVHLSIQDPSGKNNANFATPSDGNSPRCRMFLWDGTTPERDGALEVCTANIHVFYLLIVVLL